MKNLAINIPSINDATSFYRGAYPMGALREKCRDIAGIMISQWSEAALRMCDGIFMQRPFRSEHMHVMQMAQQVGCKVWVDYDDYLFGVPTDNPTCGQYGRKDITESVEKCLRSADVVTVSTEKLKELYLPYNSNILVAPNALDFRLKVVRDREVDKRRKIICWRGSSTHQRDLFTYARSIVEASRDPKHADWQWHFIGYNPWFITDSMPHESTFLTGTDLTRPMGPIEYLNHFCMLRPSALIVPLADSQFNRCKSNIAWIEATLAGAVCIAPDWPEWNKPGVLTYKNEAEFMANIYAVTSGGLDIAGTVANSWNYIQEHLSLDKANLVRKSALVEMFGCDIDAL